MKRYIRCNESAELLSQIELFAQNAMKQLGDESMNCKPVSEAIERKFNLKSVRVYITNGDGSQSSSLHYCNLSQDSHKLYDFTGDQFNENNITSNLWVYYRAAGSECYVSLDHESSYELSKQYPTIQDILQSNDADLFGVQLY